MNKTNVEKRSLHGKDRGAQEAERSKARAPKKSEYGKQLEEKQRVKFDYGLRERQFKNWFEAAAARPGGPGENLLAMLERRLDNVVYRLKLANTRRQARQIITHGHVLVNGKKVSSPSYQVSINDKVSLMQNVMERANFLSQVVDKRLNIGVKVPDWLELNKEARTGTVLRYPVRADIQAPIEEYLIVELYSK